MDQLTILTWAIGGGFAGTWTMMFFMYKTMEKRFEQVEKRIDRLAEKVEDIDRRLCRIEGAITTSIAFIHEKPKVA